MMGLGTDLSPGRVVFHIAIFVGVYIQQKMVLEQTLSQIKDACAGLDPKDLASLIKAFQECFAKEDRLWLFGSRVDDTERGGDIDLYIEVQDYDAQRVFKARSCFWNLLQAFLDEQKIDIVVRDPNQGLLIYQIARQGVRLV